jgi:hypothetical protein
MSHYGLGPWSLQIQIKQFTNSSNGLFFLSSRVMRKRVYQWVSLEYANYAELQSESGFFHAL